MKEKKSLMIPETLVVGCIPYGQQHKITCYREECKERIMVEGRVGSLQLQQKTYKCNGISIDQKEMFNAAFLHFMLNFDNQWILKKPS